MRRRRGFKGTWFPVYGTSLDSQGGFPWAQGIHAGINTLATGEASTVITRVMPDEPLEEAEYHSLQDIVGQEYALRRIVGKIGIVWTGGTGDPETIQHAKIAAGFFIARADDQDSSYPLGAGGTSFGSADVEKFNSFSPLSTATMREPWIWRRTWILANQLVLQQVAGTDFELYNGSAPPSNLYCGSVLDGPHIDAKTRRRVSSDDRLYFAISAVNWPYNPATEAATREFDWDLDVRVFGALRKARNKGAF